MSIQISFRTSANITGLSNAKRYKNDWFGSRLKRAREAIAISQEQLAERLDVSRLTVVRWESGRLKPGFDRLRPIAEATGKPLSWFFTEPNEEIPPEALPVLLAGLEQRLTQMESTLGGLPERIAEAVATRLAK